MHLLPEPLYSLQSDNIHFLCAAGTSGGRIFLGARDGCVYEIIYQVSLLCHTKPTELSIEQGPVAQMLFVLHH